MKWEHKVDGVAFRDYAELEAWLDQYGQEGWELVALIEVWANDTGTAYDRGVFKRPIPDELPPVEFIGENRPFDLLTEEEQKARAQRLMELLESAASPERRRPIGVRENDSSA